MKIDRITSFGSKLQNKPFDEIQDEQLLKLYKQFKETPFDYAIINYTNGKESKIKTYQNPINKFSIKNFFTKIFKMLSK